MTDGPADPVAAAEAAIRPALRDRLRTAVAADDDVAAALREWRSDLGDDPVERAAARQAAVLTNRVRYRTAVGADPPAGLDATPVLPFRACARPDEVDGTLSDLAADLTRAGEPGDAADRIGDGYERALADEERRARGQFYTPAPVADVLVEWALDGVGDRPRVLDPAAGTGTFQRSALDHLRGEDAGGRVCRARLVAVDVDEVALHLAGLRLAARAGGRPPRGLDRRATSFFDLEPADVGRVDAVVGNPPFVRAGDLTPDRAHFRAHLDAYGPGDVPDDGAGPRPYADGDRALSRRTDASAYFLTHATRFLRPGGRLAVVLPAKWLESKYGVGFRRFLADQYRVEAVVGFDARTFDALVDTVLLLAERRRNPGDAAATGEVRFVRVDAPAGLLDSLSTVLDGRDPGDGGTDGRGPAGRRREIRRSAATFATARQCSPYLRAPAALLSLVDHPEFVPLGDLASVARGVTTGSNRFFLLGSADRERWDIDGRLLRPALRSVRGVESRELAADDVAQSILDVHPLLEGQFGDGSPAAGSAADRAKVALRDAGHGHLADYVEHAEARGWHEGRTCQSRRVWFDLGPLPRPDAFVPKLLRERVFTVRNDAGAVPSNAIDCLAVRDGVDTDLLLAVLDSSLCRALMEVWGRDEAGMLQLMTAETRTLPVPDVRSFPAGDAAEIRSAADGLGPDGDGAGQRALDEAVVGALDLDLGAERIGTLRRRLLRRRIDGGERADA